MTFYTTLINESYSPKAVVEPDGTTSVRVEPGESLRIHTHDPEAFLAQFESVRFLPQAPWAEVVLRPGFQLPAMKWPVTFVNKGEGSTPFVTVRMVAGRAVSFMKGVAVTVDVPAGDEFAPFERVELNVVAEHKERSSDHDGYMVTVNQLQDKVFERSAKELERLAAELESHTADEQGGGQ